MKFKTIFVLLLMLVVALFSVQNAEMITVRFLHWQFALSLALVIMLAAFSGALAGLAIGALSGGHKNERLKEESKPTATDSP